MSAAGWRGIRSRPLALLFLTFPGIFLPLDMIWAGTGIIVYATWEQAARIVLHSAALAVLLSALVCAFVAWLPRRFALVLCLTLCALSVLYSLLLWSQYYDYSLDYQWVRQAAVVLLALAAGPFLARRLREDQLASLRSVMLAGTTVMALAALGSAALLAASAGEEPVSGAAAQPAAERPPIFLITVDTLSAPYLPMYGSEHPTAPRLAQFAQGATVFLRAYANSNFTTPAVNSIMHGTRPWTHRAVHLEAQPLSTAQSLPALLRAAGYYTAAVSTNTWAAPRNLGITAHFSALSENNVCAASDPVSVLPPELQIAVRGSLAWSNLHWLAVRAADWLGLCAGRHFDPELAFAEARGMLARAPAGRPLFLWVHLFDAHDRYLPHPGHDFGGTGSGLYDGEIAFVDRQLEGLVEAVAGSSRAGSTAFVVHGSHGEGWGEHGVEGHGADLWEAQIRVPLVVSVPGAAPGRYTRGAVSTADVAPTVLELAGAPADEVEGRSLAAIARGALDTPGQPVFARARRRAAVVDWPLKLLVHVRKGKDRHILFDLATDPGEEKDLSESRRDDLVRLVALHEKLEAEPGGEGSRADGGGGSKP